MRLLVTHHSPDLDAIGSVWMLRNFDAQHYADAKVAFVDPGKTVTPEDVSAQGFANYSFEEITHVDTGLGEFDHHQADRGQQHLSATSLTYEHVCKIHPELKNDQALKTLVELITDIDHFAECFWPEANHPRYALMLHEVIDGIQRAGLHTDETQLHFGLTCLNGVYRKLEDLEKSKQEMAEGKEFETKWGKGIAVETGTDAVIKYAQKAGYTVVIKKDPEEGTARIKGIPIPGLDLTPLADEVMRIDTIGTWYFHPAKTMLLNGSDKARERKPTPLSLAALVELAEKTLK